MPEDYSVAMHCACGQLILVTRAQADGDPVACPRCHTFFTSTPTRGSDADTDH